MSRTKRREYLSGPARMPLSEARSRIQNAVALAGLTMFVSAPMFYHEFDRLGPRIFKRLPTPHQLVTLAVGQALILFGLAVLCALVGFLYAHRLGLPGFGERHATKSLLAPLAAGLALIPVSYLLFERQQLATLPELFPRPWYFALDTAAASALGQEVIARFGLVTIWVYLLRWRGLKGHPWSATAVISAFMVFGQFLRLGHLKVFPDLPVENLTLQLGAALVFQAALCETYLRRGLLAALALHLGFGLRLVIYSLA